MKDKYDDFVKLAIGQKNAEIHKLQDDLREREARI